MSKEPEKPDDPHDRTLAGNVHPADWTNPEPAQRYNLVVVGAGTAGLVAAAGAASLGARVALTERHLMGGDCLNYGCVPSKAIITSPEVAHVGLYPNEAEAKGIAIDTYTQELNDVDRAILEGETEGFVRIHTKKGTDRILGATIVAANAGDMISEITMAMTHGLGLKKIADTIHPYPTQAEAIRKVGDLYNRSRLTPLVKTLFQKWLACRR